jgi:autophagy-related protein 17
VPPDFHQESEDSSIFGSQHSDDETNDTPFDQSPSNTVRENLHQRASACRKLDRSKWKTLRDFVDERAIEDALDNMDRDRSVLDVGYQGFVQNID